MLTDELLRFVQREENAGMEFIKRAKSARGANCVFLYGAGVQ